MSDLLQAAKAVIEFWDADATDNLQDEVIDNLRAAVERAENPPATFMVWWKTYPLNTYGMAPAFHGWEAGQHAERERIKKIVEAVGIQGEHDQWFDACDTIMERIDDV